MRAYWEMKLEVYICCMHIFVPDIPDDEAQYWTGKLERINRMGIHDEVKYSFYQKVLI